MKEKAKGTEREQRRGLVNMKKIAEGAITDRPKMKQRRRSNHGPSKIERKSERKSEQSNLHRETSHGLSKNEATQAEQSRTVEN
jgi:hypothetical protein